MRTGKLAQPGIERLDVLRGSPYEAQKIRDRATIFRTLSSEAHDQIFFNNSHPRPFIVFRDFTTVSPGIFAVPHLLPGISPEEFSGFILVFLARFLSQLLQKITSKVSEVLPGTPLLDPPKTTSQDFS